MCIINVTRTRRRRNGASVGNGDATEPSESATPLYRQLRCIGHPPPRRRPVLQDDSSMACVRPADSDTAPPRAFARARWLEPSHGLQV